MQCLPKPLSLGGVLVGKDWPWEFYQTLRPCLYSLFGRTVLWAYSQYCLENPLLPSKRQIGYNSWNQLCTVVWHGVFWLDIPRRFFPASPAALYSSSPVEFCYGQPLWVAGQGSWCWYCIGLQPYSAHSVFLTLMMRWILQLSSRIFGNPPVLW